MQCEIHRRGPHAAFITTAVLYSNTYNIIVTFLSYIYIYIRFYRVFICFYRCCECFQTNFRRQKYFHLQRHLYSWCIIIFFFLNKKQTVSVFGIFFFGNFFFHRFSLSLMYEHLSTATDLDSAHFQCLYSERIK